MSAGACVVCAEPAAAPNVAICLSCKGEFHLQTRMDVPGKDCGQVWLHEQDSHLLFGCNTCLEAGEFAGAGGPEPASAEGR